MPYNSTSDNLLHNIVLNTDNLDKGDFPSLVGMIIASDGSNFLARTQADLIESGAYIYEGTYISMPEIVQIYPVTVANGNHLSDIDTIIDALIRSAAGKYLIITSGGRAWFKIKKVEFNYLYTGATAAPTSSTATYKLTAEVYNED